MKEKPRSPKENLFDKTLIEEIAISGITIGLLVFALWFYLLRIVHVEVTTARAYVMALMIIIQNIHAFNCRSEKSSVFTISPISNPIFIIGVIGSMILGIAVMEIDFLSIFLKTTSIPATNLLGLFCLGLSILVIMECYKKIKYHK